MRKKTRREREAVYVAAEVPATGWKPRVWWMTIAGRGFGEFRQIRRYRFDEIELARERGRELLRSGWSWAWVEERTQKTRGV